MKTKFFKFVLPVFALLMAVSFAFATKSTRVLTAYYFNPSTGWQTTVVSDDCNRPAGQPCKIGAYQLYADMSFTNPLHRIVQ